MRSSLLPFVHRFGKSRTTGDDVGVDVGETVGETDTDDTEGLAV